MPRHIPDLPPELLPLSEMPWFKRLALAEGMPVAARAFSLRLYRAALYADAI